MLSYCISRTILLKFLTNQFVNVEGSFRGRPIQNIVQGKLPVPRISRLSSNNRQEAICRHSVEELSNSFKYCYQLVKKEQISINAQKQQLRHS